MFNIKCFLVLYLIIQIKGFDYDELEIFDLVEEVNKNFYEVLDISKDATSTEVRRAYRKKSLVIHPDKNKDEDAAEQFRQLAAIYEVLKDQQKRKTYDHVLEFGLPDWRQPIFYYRRVRKLGLAECAALVAIIFTFVHYICLWAVFLEKKFVLYEKLREKYNQKKSRKKQKEQDSMYEQELEEGLEELYRPRLTDILPARISIFFYTLVTSVPTLVREHFALKAEEKRIALELERITNEELDNEKAAPTPRRQYVHTPAQYGEMTGAVTYTAANDQVGSKLNDEEKLNQTLINQMKTKKAGTEWTDEDYNNLSKAMSKLPGGTPQRWEKISDLVGRPLNEVTLKSKQIRTNYAPVSNTMGMKLAGANTKIVADTVMTQRLDESPSYKNNEKKRVTFKEVISVNVTWTQDEQSIFEQALSKYGKGTIERWTRISACIQNKNKDDCIARFKYLADVIKKKKITPRS